MLLPSPPSDREKYLYLKQNKLYLYSFGTFSLVCLISGMVLFAFAAPSLYLYLVFVGVVVFYLTISYVVGIFGKGFNFDEHQEIITKFTSARPTVDIYLPNCGEDIQILENTFLAVSKLIWDDDKINVYVLDDKGRDEVSRLSARFGFAYLSRPNKGELKKAGNLRYAFPQTTGEYIVIYDADFAPRPDFLLETLPYFTYDPD